MAGTGVEEIDEVTSLFFVKEAGAREHGNNQIRYLYLLRDAQERRSRKRNNEDDTQ